MARRLLSVVVVTAAAVGFAGCAAITDQIAASADAADYFSAATAALITAAGDDDTARVRSLITRGADINERGSDRDRRRVDIVPLQWAAEFDRPHTVEVLLRAGADPHLPGAGGYNTVAYTLVRNRHDAFRTLLETDPTVVHAADRIGGTIVHTAVRHHRTAALQHLIDSGADLDSIQPLARRTPLFTAADVLNIDACLTLLRNGANGAHRDNTGATFLPALYTPDDDALRTDHYLRTRAAIETEMRTRGYPIDTGR